MPSPDTRSKVISIFEAAAMIVAFHKCENPSDAMLDDPKVSARLVDGSMFVRFSDRNSPKGTTIFLTEVTMDEINELLSKGAVR